MAGNSVLAGFQGQPLTHFTSVQPFLVCARYIVAQSCTLQVGRATRQQLDLLPNCISEGTEVQSGGNTLVIFSLDGRVGGHI